METVLEIIKRRYSVRTYSSAKLESDKKDKMKEYVKTVDQGPFGNTVRLQIVDAEEDDIRELKKLGTYGNTNGARVYIAGAVKKGEKAMEDFGFCMEKSILKATELGLGTVWLGGSLNRSSFAKRIGLSENEVIAAVTPIGYAADKRSAMDRVIGFLAHSRNRKKFEEIFFNGTVNNPLNSADCKDYSKALEGVRLAPSASNKQPWRIVKEDGKNIFHFYMKEDLVYNNAIKDIKIQNIDMGIAMCHFELAAGELGLKGKWAAVKPTIDSSGLHYIVSWEG